MRVEPDHADILGADACNRTDRRIAISREHDWPLSATDCVAYRVGDQLLKAARRANFVPELIGQLDRHVSNAVACTFKAMNGAGFEKPQRSAAHSLSASTTVVWHRDQCNHARMDAR